MSKDDKRLPSKIWLVISLIPILNWIPIVYIGISYKKVGTFVMGVLYLVLSLVFPNISVYFWLAGIIHFFLVNNSIKKTLLLTNSSINSHLELQRNGLNMSKLNTSKNKKYNLNDKLREQIFPSTLAELTEIQLVGNQENSSYLIPKINESKSFTKNYEDTINEFCSDVKKYASNTMPTATFVPYCVYMPTYKKMSQGQKAFYFYWRNKIKLDQIVKTDFSYILLYVFELLSEIGFKTPEEGFNKLMFVWNSYRSDFPILDDFMVDWTFDFALKHNFEKFPNYFEMIPKFNSTIIINKMIEGYSNVSPLKMPLSHIMYINNYSIYKSKFYEQGNEQLMEEVIPRIVALADAMLTKKTGKGLLATYGPSESLTFTKYLYPRAICPDSKKKIYVNIKNYDNCENLKSMIANIIRHGENVLRTIKGYKSKLKNIELDTDIANQIQLFLKKEYSLEPLVKKEPEERKIELDFSSINTLRMESDFVRDALNVETDENIIENENIVEEKPLLAELEEVTEISTFISEENSQYFDLGKLDDNLKSLLENLSPDNQKVLCIILNSTSKYEDIEKIASEKNTMVDLLIDEINGISLETIGDVIIDLEGNDFDITEEYKENLLNAIL